MLRGDATSPRYPDNPRLHDISLKSYECTPSSRLYDTRHSEATGRMNLNGSLSPRNNYTSPYHSSSGSTSFPSRPTYFNSRSHEEYSSLKSPQSKRYDQLGSLSETNSPRDYNLHSHRKYSFETADAVNKDYHYTPKGTRKYDAYSQDTKSSRKLESPHKAEATHELGQQWAERNDRCLNTRAGGRDPNQQSKYPALPVPPAAETSARGRESTRELSRNFLPSWKFSSWTLSSPLNFRRLRTSSTDRSTNFDTSRRQQPTYRSLNERDKQFYSSSGRSDKL